MFTFFQGLFRRKKMGPVSSSTAVETAPLSAEQLMSVSQVPVKINPPQLIVSMAQSVGLQRDHNEDTLYAMQAIFADGNADLPFGIFIVADGMGGHLNGEIASGCAARAMSEYLITKLYTPFLTGRHDVGDRSIQEIMEDAVVEAHRSVLRNAPGGGTTLTAALVIGDQVTFSHVGDSRAYFLYPDGRSQVVTQDHSLVRRLQDLGQIDEKEANNHPQRNVLYRALGQSEPFRPDVNTLSLPHIGYMLICSDGLWGSVPDEEILRIVTESKSLVEGSQGLIEAANAAGGPDNISAVLVKYVS
ncbi:MAG: serine/threonine-protein phosphatase [Anaerolineaceae bacterium]|nr:serine/threonine-protein phosphatase [Anaerolineaceae bacterium]